MKKFLTVIVIAILASSAHAATLVFKGGKKIEVAGYQNKAGSVIVKHANGRMESFPVSAVDLEATRVANGIPEPQKTAQVTPVPHSPYLGAVSAGGGAAPAIKDADVRKFIAPESVALGEEKPEEEQGQVVIVNHEKKKLADGQWELAITVANTGNSKALGVTVNVKVKDDNKVLTNSSGTLAGPLEPGKQATIPVRFGSDSEPTSFVFDLTWKVIQQAPSPTAPAVPSQFRPRATPLTPVANAPSNPPAMSIPEGASPMTLPSNPMGVATGDQINTVPKVKG